MQRITNTLKYDFKFKKFEIDSLPSGVFTADFDDSNWQNIRIPHDWAIYGEFSPENDPTITAVTEDGMEEETLMVGWTGGLPTVGSGVYRKWITVENRDKVFLQFDGIMWSSRVYVNGMEVGGCHFGYKSFEIDITEFVNKGEKNLISIYAEVRENSGRWYTGAGIFRNVRLVYKDNSHIAYNGVFVRQTYADKNNAVIDITADLVNADSFTAEITAPNGDIKTYASSGNSLIFDIKNPMLWDIFSPNLYTAKIQLQSGDCEEIKFGIRFCDFTKDGFFLNGNYTKIKGVCLHHDLGSLGAAINRSALKRQLEIMQSMGVNAIRTSHNPPAIELLDLCDSMGLLVMDEFFDEWEIPKVKNGYAKFFKENAVTDALDIIKRDHNHPSVIMWSIGNEVRDQEVANGWKNAKLLYDAVRSADPTRPITSGFNYYPQCIDNHLAFYTNIVGLNYKPFAYRQLREKYPEMKVIGCETASCISTRGVYHFPVKPEISNAKWEDLCVSAYELVAPPWANYAELELAAQEDNPNVYGEFMWTGFDYIGEPTPYYTEWPSRSSYFGAVDLAGLPKNRYYCYRSAWTNTPTLHIFPHWNWEGKEGENIPVHIYTNYDEVELFINGASQGKRKRSKDKLPVLDEDSAKNGVGLSRFRLMWNDCIYTPGEITAVAYKNGIEAERKTVKTAGEPHHIELSTYKKSIFADGDDLNYITATIVDKDGNLCPNACNRLEFKVQGAAELLTTDAGDQRECESFYRADKKALSGMLVCCVRSLKDIKGEIFVSCETEDLLKGTVSFDSI